MWWCSTRIRAIQPQIYEAKYFFRLSHAVHGMSHAVHGISRAVHGMSHAVHGMFHFVS